MKNLKRSKYILKSNYSNIKKIAISFRASVLLSLYALSFPAHSQAIQFSMAAVKVTTVGVHGSIPYFRIMETLEAKCAYSIIYIPGDKKLLYAQLLMAKATAEGKLVRLNYTLTNGPNSECHADIIEME